MSNVTSLLSGTVTVSGSAAFYADGDQAILFWNIQGPVTGSSPTIQFFASEVDPSDNITVIGVTASSLVITGTAIDQLQFSFRRSPVILVSWVISGASASFSNVSLTIASGNTGVMTIGSSTITLPSRNTTTTVASSASNVQLLAANASRLGSTIFNDSSSMLYVKLGSTATLTDFTIKVFPQSYYEVPFGFTGNINGFWISANGSARVGELT
jgi:hypothetical protein